MKRFLPWLITGLFAAWIAAALFPRSPREGFDIREFGQLPVLLNGRVQPLDSVARNSLLVMRGGQTVPVEHKTVLSGLPLVEAMFVGQEKASSNEWWVASRRMNATEWLMEVMMRPEQADTRRIFYVTHPELRSLLRLPEGGQKYFSFNDLRPGFDALEPQAKRVLGADGVEGIKPELRTPFEKQVAKLFSSLQLYLKLKNTLRPDTSDSFTAEIAAFRRAFPAGLIAVRHQQAGEDYDKGDFQRILALADLYQNLSKYTDVLVVPPPHPETSRDNWSNVGASLLATVPKGEVDPAVTYYAAMIDAYRQDRPADFNRTLAQYRQWLGQRLGPELTKGRHEFFFNEFGPFNKAIAIYIFALLLAAISWLNWSQWLNRTAFYLVILGFIVHTAGLVSRMILEGRPPVTNLYSSAIFIGWGAVLLGIVLERIYRDGIGLVTASTIGFLTLLIAHHLSLEGDTMEMLRAVLDTNFWLATHVVTVTIGYASTFVAGFLGILYILRGFFTRSLSEATAKALARMMYGIVCFATLFSFIGTVLGGIWADQSWGRFWGWDPKENGALIIVLWNATILHARWGGMIRERGLAAMTVFGNIVTSWSWFGVNMLGIGLHAYGFMDKALFWLVLFVCSQVALIALAAVPPRHWASFRAAAGVAAGPSPAGPFPGIRKPGPASAGA
ncbi:MAG: cytochrome c biogenesis protein CcsA [Verrucomicrobia bacterium]|nr:cytochrome c biogenesis protein CcsA [Verrucomicrobiota bacterium]